MPSTKDISDCKACPSFRVCGENVHLRIIGRWVISRRGDTQQMLVVLPRVLKSVGMMIFLVLFYLFQIFHDDN